VYFNASAVAIPTTLALLIFFKNQRDVHNKQVREQIKIINGMLGELDVLQGDKQEVYGGGTTIGNINWYKEAIEQNKIKKLNHKINLIHMESYLINFDGELCETLNVRKLIRTLSNINDKIAQLNSYVFDITKHSINDKILILEVINEAQSKISCLKCNLEAQKVILSKKCI
jgi:hypothetical protein